MVFFLDGTGACVLEVDWAALGADGLAGGAAFFAAGFLDEEAVLLVTLFFADFFLGDFFCEGIFFIGTGVFFGADFLAAVFFDVVFFAGLPFFLPAAFLAETFLAPAFLGAWGFLPVVFFDGFLLVLFLVGAGFFFDLAMVLEGYVLGGPASAPAQRGQMSP
jgi:hypothetical protein